MNIHSPTTEAPPKLQDVFESIWPETAYVFLLWKKLELQPNQKPTKVVVPSPWSSTSARPFKAILMVRYLWYFSVYASSGYPCHVHQSLPYLPNFTDVIMPQQIVLDNTTSHFLGWKTLLSLDLFRQFRVDQPDQCLKIPAFNSNP